MRTIGVGVIGCGSVAQFAHLPAYQSAVGVRIVGIADPDANRLDFMSHRFRVEKAYRDYHDLLEEGELAAVSVCVPTYLHHEIVVQAAQKGIHVLCEKPLGRNLEEALDMVTQTRKSHVQLYVGFAARFSRIVKEMMKLLRDDFVCELVSVQVRIAAKPPPVGSWYLDRERGGGALFDTGAHAADLLLHCFGGGDVSSAAFEVPSGGDVDVAASVSVSLNSGIGASLDVDWRSRIPLEFTLAVQGKSGNLICDLVRSQLRVKGEGIILGKHTNGFTMQVEQRVPIQWAEIWEFVDSVRNGKESDFLASSQEGVNALKLVEAAYRHFPSTTEEQA
jgi:predicted dehydrogenase